MRITTLHFTLLFFVDWRRIVLFVSFLIISSTSSYGEIIKSKFDGYIIFSRVNAPPSMRGGFSFHSVVWPQLPMYPGDEFQMGLPHTWMEPDTAIKGYYTTIEGGLGWWSDTRFATIYPKFIMGGVAKGFSHFANGPQAGVGQCADKSGKFGVAQLSNRLVWPPDGLNLKQGTVGELFGYGYLPLPFVDPRTIAAGFQVPTGGKSWTLFLNTHNFKGPVSFFLPVFWTAIGAENAQLNGYGFDTRNNVHAFDLQMENQYIPAVVAKDGKGKTYAKVYPIQFPVNYGKNSLMADNFTNFDSSALTDSVRAWFAGGSAPSGRINTNGAKGTLFNNETYFGWEIFEPSANKKIKVDVSTIMTPLSMEQSSATGYSWKSLPANNETLIQFPQYFQLEKGIDTVWKPVDGTLVPKETGLVEYVFPVGKQNNSVPYTNPYLQESAWITPGPKAGPFYIYLGDGSKVTYFWYRFADQPAMQCYGMTEKEKKQMQSRVEKIHANWNIEKSYLPSPNAKIKLADLDPNLIVTPPAGLEIGYVPIVVQQELNKDPISAIGQPNYPASKTQRNIVIYSHLKNTVLLEISEAGNYKVTIHSLNGRIKAVHNYAISKSGGSSVHFQTLGMAQGMYLFTIAKDAIKIGSHMLLIQE